ncbi:MAG: protein kinase, partial [Planctomycetales bacterium]|nr:protein kinase [Planctomycetales bacterium]
GIVHRDIKPGNLLVDDAGKAWVTDFGLAQIESLPELTLTGDVIGTLRYMSPEQTLGKRRHVDHRTDIYSLGVTLYELLTLQPAFADDDRHELLRSIAVGSCLPPRQRVSSIPFELDTIVQKAMATSPEDRYSAASELAEDLKSFVADRPIRARPPSLFDLAVKWSRRHRATVVWCIVLLVVIAVGSLFAAVHLAAKNEALIRSEREKVDILRNALVAQARATRRSGQVGQRFDALDALHNATELMPPRDLSDSAVEELRNEAVAALALPDLRLDSKLDLPPGVLAIDGRLERQAIAGANGSIRIQRTRDGQVITTLPAVGETPVGAMVFSQNGAFLAAKYQWHADAETRVCIWRLAKGTVQMDLKVDPRAEIEFGGTGETVFFVMSDGAVTQFHLATGKQLSTIVHQGERRQVLKANRDNTLLAVSNSSTDKIHIYEAATGVKLSEFSNRSVPYSMDWHPSGRYLAAGGNDFVTRVWDISQTPRLVSELHGHQAETVGVYFSGNGELVVTRSHDGTIRLWNPFTGWQRCLAMGRIIAYDKQESRFACVSTGVSNGIEIWDVADASEMRVLVEDRQLKGPFAIDVSQNGRFMASCGSDGVWIWDLQSGEVMQRLPLAGRTALFHNGKLLTSSELGILEWPMQMAGSKFTIGPPRRLASGGVPHHQCFAASCAKCDTLLAITDWNQATLLQVDTGRTLATFEAPDAVHAVALSNDGRWAVTAGTNFDVWDTHTNERTKSLVTPGSNPGCLFSPDGDFLITSSSDDVRIWKVGSWELEQRFALRNALRCPLAFSSDGRLLAMAESRFHAQIVDTHTWQRLAVLESQFPGQLTSLAFTRDDAKLMVATESHEIRAWDLRLINRRLRALGVAWTAFPRHIAELPFGDHDCRAPVCSTDLGPSWADWQGERYSRFAP